MQKKIIVLAIAAALSAPALALADATVYGLVDLSIDMVKNGNAAPGDASANQLNSNNSRIGFKGSEDLGGGMAAIWQMEGTVSMDAGAGGGTTDSATSLFNRNTYLGLKSDSVGTLVLGQHDTPYKSSTRKLDVFADSLAADNRKPMGVQMMSAHDARVSNVIGYSSPSMSGMSIAAASMFGAETPTAGTGVKKGSGYSLAGMYDQGPIYATLAYQTFKLGSAGTGDLSASNWDALLGLPAGTLAADDEAKAFKLGGSYAMDAFAVNAVYESTTANAVALGTSSLKNTNLYLSGKFNVSASDAVKVAYTKRGATKAATTAKDGATQVAVGYDHGMSKNTTVYALYSKITQEEDPAPAAANPDPSTISFGIKHSF